MIVRTTACLLALAAATAAAQSTRSTMLPPAAGERAMTPAAGGAMESPATMPSSTMPSSTMPSVAADSSTPRGTLKSLILAMENGDGAKIKTLIATTNPTEQKMADALANMAVSQKRFLDAANKAYGATGAKALVGDNNSEATAEGLRRLDAAKETIDGDRAVVDAGPAGQGAPPLALIKSEGMWKIPVSELARGVDQATINERLDNFAFMSGLMNESADEINKGMYKTPQQAGEAIQGKMTAAMTKRAVERAATMPSTTPGGPSPDNAAGQLPPENAPAAPSTMPGGATR